MAIEGNKHSFVSVAELDYFKKKTKFIKYFISTRRDGLK